MIKPIESPWARRRPAAGLSRVVGPLVMLALLLTVAFATPTSPRASGAEATGSARATWIGVTSPGTGPFRGLTAVSRKVAWVGGDNGELWRTTDGGSSWVDVAPPNSTGLGFRRIVPLEDGRVVLFSRGGVDNPDGEEPSLAARIFVSSNNGRSWRLAFLNDDPAAFYDCLDMFDDGRHGLAVSDPVEGHVRVIVTADGGRSWQVAPSTGMPPAVEGEFPFATGCLRTSGNAQAWFGTGGSAARIFHTTNRGITWTTTPSTIAPDPENGGGVFGLSVRSHDHLLAVGGTFADFDLGTDASAYSPDGRIWRAGGDTGGLRFNVSWVPGLRDTAIAGGFNGTDLTRDGGRTWTTFSSLPYGSVDCASDGVCWGTGEDGTVGRLFLH